MQPEEKVVDLGETPLWGHTGRKEAAFPQVRPQTQRPVIQDSRAGPLPHVGRVPAVPYDSLDSYMVLREEGWYVPLTRNLEYQGFT